MVSESQLPHNIVSYHVKRHSDPGGKQLPTVLRVFKRNVHLCGPGFRVCRVEVWKIYHTHTKLDDIIIIGWGWVRTGVGALIGGAELDAVHVRHQVL